MAGVRLVTTLGPTTGGRVDVTVGMLNRDLCGLSDHPSSAAALSG